MKEYGTPEGRANPNSRASPRVRFAPYWELNPRGKFGPLTRDSAANSRQLPGLLVFNWPPRRFRPRSMLQPGLRLQAGFVVYQQLARRALPTARGVKIFLLDPSLEPHTDLKIAPGAPTEDDLECGEA